MWENVPYDRHLANTQISQHIHAVCLTLVMLIKIKMPRPLLIFSQSDYDPGCWYKFKYWIANSVDPDQLASSEANQSGSTLFTKAGHIRVKQDKG